MSYRVIFFVEYKDSKILLIITGEGVYFLYIVSVHKISNNERFNTNEVKDNFLVLLDYMNENYGVKGHNYDVEIIGAWPNNRAVSEEYPDNLEVIEIDIDITI